MTKNFTVKMKSIAVLLLLLGVFMAQAQTRTVSGKVTSADDGSGIPGVNIVEKGTSNGAATDADGNYKINVGAEAILVFSFIGYATQEFTVGERTSIDVSLKTDVTALDEVVVIGYGEVKKKDATGAVVDLSSRDFNKGVLTSPQDLLLGKFAGVAITSTSGAPGAENKIRIRGGASLNASNDPLIVIDGFPIDNTNQSGVPNPLASINPNDIESFTVLKDASATAIYGSRASNGVIIVTTKKGASGKLKFAYNGVASVSTAMNYVDVMNAAEYREYVTGLSKLPGSTISNDALKKLGTSDTDWQKEIYRSAISTDHNVSASGAIKNVPIRLSYGYTDQQGILRNTGVKRNSLNLNVAPTLLNGDLKLNISAKGNLINNNFGETGAVGNAVEFDPTQPVFDQSQGDKYGGYFTWLTKDPTNGVNGTVNPVAQVNQTNNQSDASRIIANIQADYRLPFFKDIRLVVNAGLDRQKSEGFNRVPLNSAIAQNQGTLVGRNNSYDAIFQSQLLDVYGNYVKQFGMHKVDFTAGYGWQYFSREGQNTNENAALKNPSIRFANRNYLVSFFGRLNYTLNGKYLVTASLRQDGSSRFGDQNKWGLFPAVALAWRVKEESFLADVEAVSSLKLRAGYGVTGQQDIPGQYFPYLAVYQASNNLAQYQLGDTFYTTLRPNAYDPNIKWESTTTYNLGLDFGFFKERLTGSVEVYQKRTEDLLNRVSIPNGVNFSNFLTTNIGSMEINGIEVTLSGDVVKTKDFNWNVGANFAAYNSNITKLTLSNDPNFLGVVAGNTVGVNAWIQRHQVGFPAYSFFAYQQVYNQNGQPIEGLYVDRSGQGGVPSGNEKNKHYYRRPVPDYLIGINTRLNYKQLDFSLSGRLSIGNYVFNNVHSGAAFSNNANRLNIFRNMLSAVNETNFVNQQTFSDYYIENASFFKMDNMSLGYTLNKLTKTENMNLRLSLTVQNAFFVTRYKGLDPEVDGGIDGNIYPRSRTFLFGVNLTF
jgi:TonB-linked SusC/RagA family outer membrane protein